MSKKKEENWKWLLLALLLVLFLGGSCVTTPKTEMLCNSSAYGVGDRQDCDMGVISLPYCNGYYDANFVVYGQSYETRWNEIPALNSSRNGGMGADIGDEGVGFRINEDDTVSFSYESQGAEIKAITVVPPTCELTEPNCPEKPGIWFISRVNSSWATAVYGAATCWNNNSVLNCNAWARFQYQPRGMGDSPLTGYYYGCSLPHPSWWDS